MKKLWVLCLACMLLFTGCSNGGKEEGQIEDYHKLLYRIYDEEGHEAYLLGTIHLNKGRIEGLDEVTQAAYEKADALALEIRMDGAQAREHADLFKVHSVKEEMEETQLQELQEIIKQYPSIPEDQWTSFNLGTIQMLASQDVIAEAGYSTQYAIDSYLYYNAKNAGKNFYEFESYQEQMELMIALGIEDQELIVETLRRKEDSIKANQELVELYRKGDVETLAQQINATVPLEDPLLQQQNADYIEKMIVVRNLGMKEKLETMMQSGEVVFAAVGAGHVLGEQGILALMEEAGYHIEYLGDLETS